MNKVNHGHIRMPENYVNQSITRDCSVTFSGSTNGVIVFHHQRLSNSTSGLCLRDTVINDTISEGPCSDQRVFFSRVKKIALAIGRPIKDDFILHFTGMQKMAHDSVQGSKVCFQQNILIGQSNYEHMSSLQVLQQASQAMQNFLQV